MLNLEKLINSKTDRNLKIMKDTDGVCTYLEDYGIAFEHYFEELLEYSNIKCTINYCKIESKPYSLFSQGDYNILVLTTGEYDTYIYNEVFFNFNEVIK